MGKYVNPGNAAFREINNDKYVDKTLMIDFINQTIGQDNKLTCVSRPRRFGKTYAARMLVAYYDCSCKSEALFDDKKIAGTALYKKHMNKYNVIRLDIAAFASSANNEGKAYQEVPQMIKSALKADLAKSGFDIPDGESLSDALFRIATEPEGKQFVFIIDEWDAVIREARKDPVAVKRFLDLLREWFKNETFTPDVVAAAYMTGILPVKKDGSQSPLADFDEYSILHPGKYAPFFGFDEKEVMGICDKYAMDFETVRQWYDGYTVGRSHSVYNPYAIMKAAMYDEEEEGERYRSYWVQSSASEALLSYINIDMDGLQETIADLVAWGKAPVDTEPFQNDMETFATKDDVLTLLIHLGYLSYDRLPSNGAPSQVVSARIPNEEVRSEFKRILRNTKHKRFVELVRKSDQLLKDVLSRNESAVASAIHDVHDSHYAPTFYNDEQSLRSVVRLACVSWVDHYGKIEELPSGHGVADIAFFPRRRSPYPGIVVELKWDKSGEGAIAQIKDRNYQKVLEDLVGEVILVGIDYDSEDKTHACRIERIEK